MGRPFSSPDVFRAVADPTRRKILDLLRRRVMLVQELAESFECSRPTLSFHLRVLRASGLIVPEPRGRKVAYRAVRAALRPVDVWLELQRSSS
ncbi:MAG: metalloregulator ArsR/SmtB family transcription factor [Phycisphaerales bacterium]|nr:metalloregulator ArsR/SmtB family transcription factor [Phycisphaerales bacterium]MCI0674918.1 metalloregulator ArsR/SmtB family transcription factor [Phycisphaerales bacterium]